MGDIDLHKSLNITIKLFLLSFIVIGFVLSAYMGVLSLTGQEVDITVNGGVTVEVQDKYTGDPPTIGYDDENSPSESTKVESSDDTTTDTDAPDYPPRVPKEWDVTLRDEDDPGHKTVTTENGNKINSEDVERYTIYYINQYREDNNLHTWKYSKALASTSRAHSEDMYSRDFFDHRNPDGEKPWDRFPSDEACQTAYGENLVKTYIDKRTYDAYDEPKTFTTEKEVGQAIVHYWQESPPHNELLTENGHDGAGVGVYIAERPEDDGYTVYATLNTCTFNENEFPREE